MNDVYTRAAPKGVAHLFRTSQIEGNTFTEPVWSLCRSSSVIPRAHPRASVELEPQIEAACTRPTCKRCQLVSGLALSPTQASR